MILDVIEYSAPDGTGCDLKVYNQVYFRAESYISWAIMDSESFSKVIRKDENKNRKTGFESQYKECQKRTMHRGIKIFEREF